MKKYIRICIIRVYLNSVKSRINDSVQINLIKNFKSLAVESRVLVLKLMFVAICLVV